jgi:hypothetical protein
MATNPPGAIPNAVHGALQASGFPFQTAVADAIERTAHWSVVASEWPWRDPESGDQFLDLVAVCGRLSLAIECKKTRNDIFTFLQPQLPPVPDVDHAYVIYSEQIRDMTRRLEVFSGVWGLGPLSAEAAFCVVSTGGAGRDQRLLERDAKRVVKATDAFAVSRAVAFQPTAEDEPRRPFVPVIVTNAQLFIARYRPTDVALDTGEFTQIPQDITPVRWVRFRKSFAATRPDLGERTVLVVNSLSLLEFLAAAETIPREPQQTRRRGHLPKPGG